jgi:hypothetical protein
VAALKQALARARSAVIQVKVDREALSALRKHLFKPK